MGKVENNITSVAHISHIRYAFARSVSYLRKLFETSSRPRRSAGPCKPPSFPFFPPIVIERIFVPESRNASFPTAQATPHSVAPLHLERYVRPHA